MKKFNRLFNRILQSNVVLSPSEELPDFSVLGDYYIVDLVYYLDSGAKFISHCICNGADQMYAFLAVRGRFEMPDDSMPRKILPGDVRDIMSGSPSVLFKQQKYAESLHSLMNLLNMVPVELKAPFEDESVLHELSHLSSGVETCTATSLDDLYKKILNLEALVPGYYFVYDYEVGPIERWVTFFDHTWKTIKFDRQLIELEENK